MNKSEYYAIAYKSGSKPNSPYAGTVRPVIVESVDRVEEANPEDFPNSGDIFVIGGYDTSLKRFSESDLFRIPYRVNTQLGQDTSHRYYCGYVAHADDAEAVALARGGRRREAPEGQDEQDARDEVEQGREVVAHHRGQPFFLYMASIRSVTRKPPKMFTAASTRAMKPKMRAAMAPP